jgi:hypothetical protein
VYTYYRLRDSPFRRPDSSGLYDYRQDEEDGAKGGAFGGSMHSGIHVGKAEEAKSPDKIEEKANSYEYVAYCVQHTH